MTPTPTEKHESEQDGATKPEDMRVAMKVGTDLAGTITKLKANNYQYATAGDTKRLIEAAEITLNDMVGQRDLTIEECAQIAENFRHPNPFPTIHDAIAEKIRERKSPGMNT